MNLPQRLLALAALSMLVACGETTAPPTTSTGPTKQAKIAAEVPSDVKSKGALQIGVDATYLPNEGIDPDTGQIVGWDIDLGYALRPLTNAAVSGLRRAPEGMSEASAAPPL